MNRMLGTVQLAMLAIGILIVPAHGAYEARLYFFNSTRLDARSGQVNANVGDVIEVWYYFNDLDTISPRNWGTLQTTLCFDGLSLVSRTDQMNWNASITAGIKSGGSLADFLTTVMGNGPLYDNAFDPTDISQLKICDNGLFLYLKIDEIKPRARNWAIKLWEFTVQPESEGQILDWTFAGRDTTIGLSTRIIDQKGATQNISDNYLKVVGGRTVTTFAGKVNFDRIVNEASKPATMEVRVRPEVGDDRVIPNVPLTPDGHFQIELPAERYLISCRAQSWLRRTAYVDLTRGDVTDFSIDLPNGDAFADGVVDTRDVNWVFVYFGSPGENYSDLNRDGETNLLDLNIVFTNYGLVGDP
jgi:hypothetical protein